MTTDHELYFVRHGETVWNRERRMQGHLDSPLTLRGIEQAQAYARQLAPIVEATGDIGIAASPLGRTWQTAVIICDHLGLSSASIERDPGLVEMTWGSWDGLTAEEINDRDPELWQSRINDRFTVAPPGGGETQTDIYNRANEWFRTRGSSKRAIIVGHGAFGRALRAAYMDMGAASMLELDEPQSAIFRLYKGTIGRIDC